MTAIATPADGPLVDPGAAAPEPHRRRGLAGVAAAALLGLALLSLVRVVTDTPDLTSSGTFGAALRLAVPIGLAGLGALYSERAGVVNIGLEGMMVLGTWFGAWAGWRYGPAAGVLLGVLGGAAGGVVHAVATVGFGVDHVISGVAVNILGAGVARFLSVVVYTPETGGGATQSPQVTGDIPEVDLPVVADLFGALERTRLPLLGDIGGVLRGATADLSILTVLALALIPLSAYLLWRTPFGLRLRAVGEHPVAAESLGVDVYRMKVIGVVVSGALAGLAGAFLVLEAAGIYREGQTGGRGFIGLAALIFGNWRPGGVALGAGLFGFTDALQLRDESAVHALLLFAALATAAFAVRAALRRRLRVAAALALVGVAFATWFGSTDEVPRQFVFFTPHVTTLVVLAAAARRLRPPAADGRPYRRGQGR